VTVGRLLKVTSLVVQVLGVSGARTEGSSLKAE